MAETINVSNYELLVRPIIEPGAPSRTVIQGYFLTIANPTSSDLEIELTFTAFSNDFDSSLFASAWDVNGSNDPNTLTFNNSFLQVYRLNLPAFDTGLFLLLPDVSNPRLIAARNTEIRGYVTLSIPAASPIPGGDDTRTLLLSVQQRGTFLPEGDLVPPAMGDFDQLAYSLPLASGRSEVTVEANVVPPRFAIPDRQAIYDQLIKDPSLLSKFSSDSLVEKISDLELDEQRQMLRILLERFNVERERELSPQVN
ncbi:MAG: hypothetical protein AAGE84_03025 [Cyanobacteria bacterium P01_G01_bin.39]